LLVLGEAILLCLLGGILGLSLAWVITPGLSEAMSGIFGSFEVSLDIALSALGLSALIGLIIGVIPAITARRLAIVDALRRG